MMRVLLALALLALPNLSHAAADEKMLRRAAEIAEICATHMPDGRATERALKDAGFRFEGTTPPWKIFSLNGRRILAGTSIPSAKKQGCIISVSKMNPRQARALIQPWLTATNASPVKAKRGTKAWRGSFRGAAVRLGVIDKINLRFMWGAAILAVGE